MGISSHPFNSVPQYPRSSANRMTKLGLRGESSRKGPTVGLLSGTRQAARHNQEFGNLMRIAITTNTPRMGTMSAGDSLLVLPDLSATIRSPAEVHPDTKLWSRAETPR